MSVSTQKVLMVCLGNICRSPTAEAVLRAQVSARGLGQQIDIDSAGTSDWHIGSPPDPRSQTAAQRRGYDLSRLRGRQVSAEDFHRFDHILAMDNSNLADLRKLCPPGLEYKLSLFLSHGQSGVEEVPDPYFNGEAGFEYVLDLIEDASAGFLARLSDASEGNKA